MKTNLTRSYTAYGYAMPYPKGQPLLAFNGERPDPLTGLYMLGLGYRSYSTISMRYSAPDTLSPFGIGGLNAYTYNKGDPINYTDPTGHSRVSTLIAKRFNQRIQTRLQILMNLDSPAHVITPSKRDAPPYYSSGANAFSSPGSPPSYDPGPLPHYSKRLPKGHMYVVGPSYTPSGGHVKPPVPPKYENLPSRPQIKTSLPPEQVAAYRTELEEETAHYRNVRRTIRIMERRNLTVPESYYQTLRNIRQRRDVIRDLLGP
ncbi:RHS repeat-associated core domain-containing protein [Enterobacterales bacterium AW_CKDN230030176-1A_HGKHYDSX7]